MKDEFELLREYRKYAVEHGAATLKSDDYKVTNRAHDALQKVFKQLCQCNADHLLLPLLEDENEWVQLWAAAHTLEIDEARAVKKLEEHANLETGVASTDAYYTLQEWKAGNLSFRKRWPDKKKRAKEK